MMPLEEKKVPRCPLADLCEGMLVKELPQNVSLNMNINESMGLMQKDKV